MDYAQFAEQHNAAYAAFTAIYQQKNPPPERAEIRTENRILKMLLVLLMISSMIVSGSRTVPEFGGSIVGVAAFFMLELGIIVYPFLRTALYYDDAKHQGVKKILSMGKWLALVVVVAANLHHMFTSNGFHIPAADEIMITALSIGAPVLAFIAGDAFGALMVRDNHRQKKADEEFAASHKAYHEELNAVWARQQKTWGVQIKVQPEPVPAVESASIDVNLRQLPAVTRPTPKMKMALEWMRQHPEHIETESRVLAELIGVSHTLANEARKRVKFELNEVR